MNPATRHLRVVAWNLHGLREPGAVVEVLSSLAPDLVLLSESGRRSRLASVAERVGMVAHVDPPAFPRRRVQDALLVRPPLSLSGVRLVRFGRSARWHPRGAMIGTLEGVAATTVAVAATHLGLHPGERLRDARHLADLIRPPFIVGGDLNEGPDGDAARLLARAGRDVWSEAGEGPAETFPSRAPSAAIDRIYVSELFEVTRARVFRGGGAERASDHLPIVADLVVGPSGGSGERG